MKQTTFRIVLLLGGLIFADFELHAGMRHADTGTVNVKLRCGVVSSVHALAV